MQDSSISGPVLSCCKMGTLQWSFLLLLIKDHNAFIYTLSHFWINQFVDICIVGFVALFLCFFLFFSILPRIE